MKYFAKELCRKLQEMGCNSSRSYYFSWSVTGAEATRLERVNDFCIYDFLSDEPYAKENSEKLCNKRCTRESDFPEGTFNISAEPCGYENSELLGESVDLFRHALLDAEDQEKFIADSLALNEQAESKERRADAKQE